MKDHIEILLLKLESGMQEEQAIKETILECHKYSLCGRNIQGSKLILNDIYYGKNSFFKNGRFI